MDVLVAHLPSGLDPGGPGDETHVGHAALVAGPALPVGEGGVERPCPSGVVVVVGRWAAEFVDVLQGQFGRSGQVVEEPPLVERPVRSALAARAVVGDGHDDRVVELARRLQEVDHSAELVVGVGDVTREDLGHPREQPSFVRAEGLPRTDRVQARPRLPAGSGRRRFAAGVDR